MEEPALEEVMNATSNFWMSYNGTSQNSRITILDKRKIIQNYLMMVRGEEEMKMIKEDVLNSKCFFRGKIKLVSEKYYQLQQSGDSYEGTDLYKAGCCNLLSLKLEQLKFLVEDMDQVFSVISTADGNWEDSDLSSDFDSDID